MQRYIQRTILIIKWNLLQELKNDISDVRKPITVIYYTERMEQWN